MGPLMSTGDIDVLAFIGGMGWDGMIRCDLMTLIGGM